MSESELPSELTLTVGEHRTLPLRSLAMAGYRWSGSVSDPAVVVLEIKRGEVTPGPRAGVSAPEEAVLRGAQPGRATVRLELRRSWERDQPPARVAELQVSVRSRAGDQRSGP